jgi:hypothetical protein
MKRIQIFELGVGKITVIPFRELIPPDLADQLKEWGKTLGVGLEITEVADATKFVEHYFTQQGYQVLSTYDNRAKDTVAFLRELEKEGRLPRGILEAGTSPGVPDYFCYREGDDWFFTEAKNENDGLRLNQLNWFYKHKYPTKILYLAEDREP